MFVLGMSQGELKTIAGSFRFSLAALVLEEELEGLSC